MTQIPYIRNKRKKALADDSVPQDVGELTYMICHLCDDYLCRRSKETGLKYQYLAEVAGALANSHSEIYRRVSKVLEDNKLISNGDCFRAQKLIRKEPNDE